MAAEEPAEIPFPETPQQYELTRDVPDHELLLVFRDDSHAEGFYEWLQAEGWRRFNLWCGSSGS